ncbi:MAG: NADH-quinone oxidoreductase subunit J [Geobacteraceae bacterium]|nr:MAG: NADH-quinone oxidoreductase subunit J [Geobacteraceae bacterium]
MNPQIIFFIPLAIVAVATALGMLASRNAVYSALNLIVNFASVAMLYLMLGAPFIALAQVTVYAGAIMVLFLFVIMLLGAEQANPQNQLKWQKPIAILLGIVLLVEAVILIFFGENVLPGTATISPDFSDPFALAETLFTSYLLPFEITSILLLVAMIGAIVLSRRKGKSDRPPVITGEIGDVNKKQTGESG